MKEKRFIVKKYIMATSAQQAIKRERRVKPDDVWVDEEWAKQNPTQLVSAIGYNIEQDYYSSDYWAKKGRKKL